MARTDDSPPLGSFRRQNRQSGELEKPNRLQGPELNDQELVSGQRSRGHWGKEKRLQEMSFEKDYVGRLFEEWE